MRAVGSDSPRGPLLGPLFFPKIVIFGHILEFLDVSCEVRGCN